MTVIGRKTQSYSYSSANTSDNEALLVESVSISDSGSTIIVPVTKTIEFLKDTVNLPKNVGKKKLRRYQNQSFILGLATLTEEDEAFNVMESRQSPFARLLDDKAAMQCWEEFITKSEDEQEIFLQSCNKNKKPDQSKDNSYVLSVRAKIKLFIKIQKHIPAELVANLDNEILQYFKEQPDGILTLSINTRYGRLLIREIVQYYDLKSFNDDMDGKNVVNVYNYDTSFIPRECTFTDFLRTHSH